MPTCTWQDPFTEALLLLAGMGFEDLDRNAELLTRHECNMQLVLDELLLPQAEPVPETDNQHSKVSDLPFSHPKFCETLVSNFCPFLLECACCFMKRLSHALINVYATLVRLMIYKLIRQSWNSVL